MSEKMFILSIIS